jgi:hypothetical protein
MAKRVPPAPAQPKLTDDLEALFRLMRSERVFVFKGMGVEVQMAQQAWSEPDQVAGALIDRVAAMNRPEPDAEPQDMPPELRAPFEVFRKRPDFIPAPKEQAASPNGYRDPTDPDAPVDDAAERGEDLPDWSSGGNH